LRNRFAMDAVRTTDPSQFHRHMKVIAQAGTGPITEPMQVTLALPAPRSLDGALVNSFRHAVGGDGSVEHAPEAGASW